MSIQASVDHSPEVLIAVADDLLDHLLAAGLVDELPTVRHSVADAVVTVGTSALAAVALLRTPAAVKSLAEWLCRRTTAQGSSISVRATQAGKTLVLRVDGEVPASLVADFLAAALREQPREVLRAGGIEGASPISSDVDDRKRVQVFVSYAHDSEPHKTSVRGFAEFLVRQGLKVSLDCWNQHERGDWQLWASQEIKTSDFVLVIASPRCRIVGDGENEAEENRGLRSEMNYLRELYHSQPNVWPKRILPVVLPGRTVDEIPSFLQPRTADHYVVEDFTILGAEDLLRCLTGQAPYMQPTPGDLPHLPPHPPAFQPGKGNAVP